MLPGWTPHVSPTACWCANLRGSKRLPGGRWADAVVADLKRCECHLDWCQQAQDWSHCDMDGAEDVNDEMKESEKACKDERKRRRELGGIMPVILGRWACGCAFVTQSKAGLVNHTRQKHTTANQCQLMRMHCKRYYPSNPTRSSQ